VIALSALCVAFPLHGPVLQNVRLISASHFADHLQNISSIWCTSMCLKLCREVTMKHHLIDELVQSFILLPIDVEYRGIALNKARRLLCVWRAHVCTEVIVAPFQANRPVFTRKYLGKPQKLSFWIASNSVGIRIEYFRNVRLKNNRCTNLLYPIMWSVNFYNLCKIAFLHIIFLFGDLEAVNWPLTHLRIQNMFIFPYPLCKIKFPPQ
jgi:hypothetical protein